MIFNSSFHKNFNTIGGLLPIQHSRKFILQLYQALLGYR
jgi:hypothetical protein